MTAQLAVWQGQFGNDYINRNEVDPRTIERLESFWHRLCGRWAVTGALEVGANIGRNLRSMPDGVEKFALEPNELARARLAVDGIVEGTAEKIEAESNSFDLVFTSGVLIHIHPANLASACDEIYRVSKRLICCIEYFSDEPETKTYRGHEGLLFKRDYGAYWLDHYPVRLLDYGFFWKRDGFADSTNWWLFAK